MMSGVRKGRVIVPFLFTIYSDDILINFSGVVVSKLYADDVDLFNNGHSDSRQHLSAVYRQAFSMVQYRSLSYKKCNKLSVSQTGHLHQNYNISQYLNVVWYIIDIFPNACTYQIMVNKIFVFRYVCTIMKACIILVT